ncbi:MAG TPA: glutamine synthetase family protein [Thermoflexales bacterium]|nr:glutamine synthetase family protein [Thermoflexales bacterium]HQZ20805.1 glutamine synthetase family protein [Thermoflexales bacterium]
MREETPSPGSSDFLRNKSASSDYVMREARDAGVRLVRCLWTDLANIVRGRAIHLDALRRTAIDGASIPLHSLGLTVNDQQAMPNLTGRARMLPDLNTFRVATYAPNTGAMMADVVDMDTQASPLCARSFLKRMMADLADSGYKAQVGFELEFYFAVRGSDGGFVPVDESGYATGMGMTVAAKVINEIIGTLDDQRIAVEHYHPEMGGGQQEITLRVTDPLTACDQVVLAREAIRAVAWTHGWYSTFMARPFENQPGSSLHAHISLWDRNGRNVMFTDSHHEDETLRLYEDGMGFIGGLMRHINALAAVSCPSANSQRRLTGNAGPAPFGAWGYDNRDVPISITPQSWSSAKTSANLEYRLADASANPYLMLGSVLAAGLDGIQTHQSHTTALSVSPSQMDEETRAARNIAPLPATLSEACDALAADPVLSQAMGEQMVETYLAIKRKEAATFKDMSFLAEQNAHLWRY